MLNNFLKKAVTIVVGKHAEIIVELINCKKPANEFNVAKKMDITINQTRNILYKLSDRGLVSSTRKKDKKKGWYTYFWKIEVLKTLEFLKSNLLTRIGQFRERIHSRESKQFFMCEKCRIEFTEENALLRNFTCPECGGVFTLKDNSKILKELQRHLEKFIKELELIEVELEIENCKLDKIKQKVLKKEEKEKQLKKAEAAEKRRKTREAKLIAAGKPIPVRKKPSAKKKVCKKIIKKVGKKVAKKSLVDTTKGYKNLALRGDLTKARPKVLRSSAYPKARSSGAKKLTTKKIVDSRTKSSSSKGERKKVITKKKVVKPKK